MRRQVTLGGGLARGEAWVTRTCQLLTRPTRVSMKWTGPSSSSFHRRTPRRVGGRVPKQQGRYRQKAKAAETEGGPRLVAFAVEVAEICELLASRACLELLASRACLDRALHGSSAGSRKAGELARRKSRIAARAVRLRERPPRRLLITSA